MKDRVTEFFGEGAALAAIMSVAWKGAKDPVVTYEVKSKHAVRNLEEFQQMNDTLGQFEKDFPTSHRKAKALDDEWYSEFRESRTVTKTRTVPDGEGGTKTETYTETENYWDEPAKLTNIGLDNRKIGHWVDFLNSIAYKTGQAQSKSRESFDLSDGKDSLKYDIKEIDSAGQAKANVAMYGAVGAAYVFYEEVFNSFDQFGFIQQNEYISRRSFMKAVVGGALSWGIRDIQLKFVDKNNNLFQELSNHNADVLSQLDVKDYDNFTRYFGSDLHSIRRTFTEIIETCGKASELDSLNWRIGDRKEWERTKPFVNSLREQAQAHLDSFDTFFQYNNDRHDKTAFTIPKELTKLTKYIWATDKITGFAQGKANEVGLRHFWNALGLGAGLGLIAGVSEHFIFPLTDDLAEKVNS